MYRIALEPGEHGDYARAAEAFLESMTGPQPVLHELWALGTSIFIEVRIACAVREG